MPSILGIADLKRACPTVSRDMIRVVLKRLRDEGKPRSTGTGRKALWEKRSNILLKRGNNFTSKEEGVPLK
jgi:hypothetical protein